METMSSEFIDSAPRGDPIFLAPFGGPECASSAAVRLKPPDLKKLEEAERVTKTASKPTRQRRGEANQ
jgi:hypothetical protein